MTSKKTKSSTGDVKSFRYTVSGNPLSLIKVNDTKPTIWDAYKQTKFNYIQTIKNQHNRRQLVDSPIQLEITFFLKQTSENSKNHAINPPIFSLFNFVYHAMQGIVYNKNCTISSIHMEKKYNKKPRTEIKITRLT